ncbi:MAG TPA: DNA mismatch repair protein MutS [Thermoanaerobaculia bacterium]|nr:DNA mismatch repair protein MutS [Thermoanaerobaculia bacterium]
MSGNARQLTPMLRHYLQVKAEHPGALVLYRMGDFYEMFFEDAVKAAPILEIALTARQRGTESEAPMCGVPHHALESYLGKLVRAGMKVAICDQMEDPAQAKGLVRREVTRVVTPGTLAEPDLLEGKEDNLLCSVAWANGVGAGAFLDISTGKLLVHRWGSPEDALSDLTVLRPRELVFTEDDLPADLHAWAERDGVCRTPLSAEDRMAPEVARRLLEHQFQTASVKGFGVDAGEPAALATAIAIDYARRTQRSELAHVRDLQLVEERDFLMLDDTTLQNLEVVRGLRGGGRSGTLLQRLDQTRTAMGGRRLRSWLVRPAVDRDEILARHDAVEELVESAVRREALRDALAGVADLERLLSRAVLGSLQPREAGALRGSLRHAALARERLDGCRAGMLASIGRIDPAGDLLATLAQRLASEPPGALRAGATIAPGVNAELDRCRSLVRDRKRHVLALESRERERTGIASLKVGYNKVFGYYLEVTNPHRARVPEDYRRRQTLTNAERYVTPELHQLEREILGAEARLDELEEEEYGRVVRAIVDRAGALRELAAALGTLDAICALAEAAARHDYRRPKMLEPGAGVHIRDGRHPVVEAALGRDFVPNDTELDPEQRQIVLLTGPNMGGKSTYLRQVALIALMAQAGSFVPASSAELGILDRIFTRVGASDDLARGESTFMVEMLETANILRHAGPRSLVILDEVGRGTATFDGLSLAWAIVEHLHDRRRALTLFATHYHELTELEALLPRVVNRTMAVREWEEKIVFLRRVVPGSADKSYGIQVARLAGLPAAVLERAGEVLANLERQEYDLTGKPRLARGRGTAEPERPGQLQLFTPPEELVASILREVDLERLSPLAALNLLHALRSRLTEPVV